MNKKCEICKSFNSLPLETGNKNINHFICKKCGLIYIWPFPTKKELEVYYGDEIASKDQGINIPSSKSLFKKEERRLKFMFEGINEEVKKILKNLKDNGEYNRGKIKILEIGSSTGHLLQAFKLEGFEVVGVEPSKKAAEFSKEEYQLKVINSLFEDTNLKEKFDLVLCIHLLEHVNNPHKFLSKVKKVMKKKGVFYLKVSNVYKPLISLKKFFTPLHLITYSPKTLANMLALNGFKLIKLDSGGDFLEAFFIKDSQINLNLDSTEYKKELNFLKKYKREYFFKFKFLTIPTKKFFYQKIAFILITFFPLEVTKRLRRLYKR